MADSVTEIERRSGRQLPDHVQRAVDRAELAANHPGNENYCAVCRRSKGELRPAKRRCPHCRKTLCANHSKAASTMKNYAANVGRRICSNCHAWLPEETFTPIERT